MWKRKARELTAPEQHEDAAPIFVPASPPAAMPVPYGYFAGDSPYLINLPPGLDLPPTLGFAPGMASLPFAPVFPEMEGALPFPVASTPDPDPEPVPARALRHLVAWLVVAVVWLALMLLALFAYYSLMMPDPRATALARVPPNIRIMAADGSFIAERGMRRDYVTHDRLPPHLVNAVISTEDRRFLYHFGFDPAGLIRAFVKNMRAGEVVQGGSTVTQQLAKNLFLEPHRTWKRKVEELFISVWLETKYTKSEIMELYLNRVYFGSGNYGIGAASYHYFNKKTEALSLSEAALLTGLIKAPSSLSPRGNRAETGERASVVLRNMLDSGFITEAEYNDALAHPAVIHPAAAPPPGFEHVVDWIAEIVPTLIGDAGSNLTIETTLDPGLQRMADATVKRMMAQHAEHLRAEQAALVVLAPDGGVKAMFGGMDYARSQFNRAVKAQRQPASVFKPFVYLAAIESGLKPESLVEDTPLEGEEWTPGNHGTAGGGLIPLKTALATSSNTAAVRIMQHVGAEKVIGAAHRLGLTSRLDVGPTLALGTAETTLLDMTAAYASFANDGIGVLPYIVTRVRDDKKRVMFERKSNDDRRVIATGDVALMNEMMSAVVESGTGRDARLADRPAAGKTGTSSGYRDAWFVGYTADFVAGVWLGNDRHTSMKFVTGGSLPAKIWRAVMEQAHHGLPPRPLPGTATAAQ